MKKFYGISSKNVFGRWEHAVSVFETKEETEEWLHTEQHDFRTRELVSHTEAVRQAGKKAVERAEYVAGLTE